MLVVGTLMRLNVSNTVAYCKRILIITTTATTTSNEKENLWRTKYKERKWIMKSLSEKHKSSVLIKSIVLLCIYGFAKSLHGNPYKWLVFIADANKPLTKKQ